MKKLALKRLQHWLLGEGTRFETLAEFIENYGLELRHQGLLVDRVFMASMVVHPQVAAYAVTWLNGREGAETVEREPRAFEKLRYPGNPIDRANGRSEPLRCRLAQGEPLDDPIFRQLHSQGYTDFVAIELRFGREFCGAVTWATRVPAGFSEVEVKTLFKLQPALCAVIRPFLLTMRQETLLRTYLGRHAGGRVHRGLVRRGDGLTLRTAIWFSDLRGFTQLSDRLSRDDLLELLNEVFEVIVRAVNSHGGEVLKFIGDGVLAIFPAASDEQEANMEVCRAARRAAVETQQALAELSSERKSVGKCEAAIGIGLNYGDVTYGNIGSYGRLDFTVIGSAVNLAARIEAACSRLGENILMSQRFAELEGGERRSLGAHEFKGVRHPVEIFA